MNKAEAVRWLAYAQTDLKAARTLIPDYPRHSCFLAQQSAEKAIKAILVLFEIDFPRTHDLDRLRDLLPEGWRVKADQPELSGLTIWAIEARYPGDQPDVVEADASAALKSAEAIYEAVETDLQKYLPLT